MSWVWVVDGGLVWVVVVGFSFYLFFIILLHCLVIGWVVFVWVGFRLGWCLVLSGDLWWGGGFGFGVGV